MFGLGAEQGQLIDMENSINKDLNGSTCFAC